MKPDASDVMNAPSVKHTSAKLSTLLVVDVQADLFAEPQAVFDGPRVLARIKDSPLERANAYRLSA